MPLSSHPASRIVLRMLNDLEARICSLIDSIKDIGREGEEVYLGMGRLFPAMMAEADRSCLVGEQGLTGFEGKDALRDGRSLDEMNSFATESCSFFKKLHDHDEDFLDRINESIEKLSALDGLIQGVRSDSEEMEIISLNAMTVALKSGSAGKAFSVITDELKRLSSQTILLTETITGRGTSLLEFFGRLRDTLLELDHFQDQFFGELEQGLSASFSSHRSDLAEIRSFLSGLLVEAREVKEPIQAILAEFGNRNPAYRSLAHVAYSLAEAQTLPGSGATGDYALVDDQLPYLASVARLSAKLLTRTIDELETSSKIFQGGIDGVDLRISAIEERRARFSTTVTGTGEAGFGVSSAGDFSAGAARYLDFKKRVITMARRLAEQVRELENSFKGLSSLLSRFKNIVVASRIEIAKNRSLGSVTTTVMGMVTLTGRIEADVSGAMTTTKDFIKIAMVAIDEYAESASDSGGQLRAPSIDRRAAGRNSSPGRSGRAGTGTVNATLDILAEDMLSLEEKRSSTQSALGSFFLFTPEFLEYTSESRMQREALLRLLPRLQELRGELLSLASDVSASLGSTVVPEIHSQRQKDMIQKLANLSSA